MSNKPPAPADRHDISTWDVWQLRWAAPFKMKSASVAKADWHDTYNACRKAGQFDLANQAARSIVKCDDEWNYWYEVLNGGEAKLPRSLRTYYRKSSHNECGMTRRGGHVNRYDHARGIWD